MKKNEVRIFWSTSNGVLWIHDISKELELTAKKLNIRSNDIPLLYEQFQNSRFRIREESRREIFSRKLIIKHLSQTMTLLKSYNISAKKFLDTFLLTDVITVNDDAIMAMALLKKEGNVKNYILSDGLKKYEKRLLDKSFFSQYIDKLYCAENFYLKNNPRAISCLVKYDKREQYYIIGSTEDDFYFGNIAGIKSIYYNPKHLPTYNHLSSPTYVIDNYSVLPNIIFKPKK